MCCFRLFYFLTGLPTPVARSMFYSQNTNFARFNLLQATYTPLPTRKYRPTVASKKLKKFIDGLDTLANERNSFIHDPWAHCKTDKRGIAQFGLKTKGSHGQIRHVRSNGVPQRGHFRARGLGPIRIAQCLNLEHEFHHTASKLRILKLRILGFEPLK